jgi:cellobiose phosphorylase
MERALSDQDLLLACRKEFPSLEWRLVKNEAIFSEVSARLSVFYIAVVLWHNKKHVRAFIECANAPIVQLFGSTNEQGTSLVQALAELRLALEEYAKAFGEAVR